MLSQRMAHLEPEDTLGEGNCALNAFALGLINKDLLNHLNLFLHYNQLNPDILFADFIKHIAGVLEMEPTWQAVSEDLLRIRQYDKIRLQKTLAPMLRNLMVAEMKKDKECIEWTIEPLLSAFRDELFKRANIRFKGSPDDVYAKLDIVREKIDVYAPIFIGRLEGLEFPVYRYNYFRSLNELSDDDNKELQKLDEHLNAILKPYEDEFLLWWRGKEELSGYPQFLNVLKRNGEWLSFLGLKYLAKFFNVDLVAHLGNCWEDVHLNKLQIPQVNLKPESIRQLRARCVIEPYSDQDTFLSFLPFDSLDVLEKHLCAVPHTERVLLYCLLNKDIKHKAVPDFFNPMKEQFRLRNIIGRGEKGGEWFLVDSMELLDRAFEIPEADIIFNWWQSHHYPAPKMILKNANAMHWENMLSTAPYPVCELQLINRTRKVVPPVLALALFVVWYVVVLEKIRQWQEDEVEIASAGPDIEDDMGKERKSAGRSLARIRAFKPSILSMQDFMLFKEKQPLKGQDRGHSQAVKPLSPSDADSASREDALTRPPCTIL